MTILDRELLTIVPEMLERCVDLALLKLEPRRVDVLGMVAWLSKRLFFPRGRVKRYRILLG